MLGAGQYATGLLAFPPQNAILDWNWDVLLWLGLRSFIFQ